MNAIKEIWPFSSGDQELLFLATGLAVLGLIALNVFIAFTQNFPLKTVLTSFFSEAGNTTRFQNILRVLFLVWLFIGFFVLVTDVMVNGNQIATVDT